MDDFLNLARLRFRLLHGEQEYHTSLLSSDTLLKLRESLEDKYKYASCWRLLFSTFEHGCSYKALLESLDTHSWPFLLVCRTQEGDVLGAFFEDKVQISTSPYGQSSVFLFTTTKHGESGALVDSSELIVFPQTGNGISIYCSPDFLAFGCSNGCFGLLINKSLLDGETHRVETFQNDPLASGERFLIQHLEVWLISE